MQFLNTNYYQAVQNNNLSEGDIYTDCQNYTRFTYFKTSLYRFTREYRYNFTYKDWVLRKVKILSYDLTLSTGKIAYHLAKMILFTVVQEEKRLFVKIHIYYILRDVQEVTGKIITLFWDRIGCYLVEESQFNKDCYNLVLHPELFPIVVPAQPSSLHPVDPNPIRPARPIDAGAKQSRVFSIKDKNNDIVIPDLDAIKDPKTCHDTACNVLDLLLAIQDLDRASEIVQKPYLEQSKKEEYLDRIANILLEQGKVDQSYSLLSEYQLQSPRRLSFLRSCIEKAIDFKKYTFAANITLEIPLYEQRIFFFVNILKSLRAEYLKKAELYKREISEVITFLYYTIFMEQFNQSDLRNERLNLTDLINYIKAKCFIIDTVLSYFESEENLTSLCPFIGVQCQVLIDTADFIEQPAKN
jgi:hypothetical protein